MKLCSLSCFWLALQEFSGILNLSPMAKTFYVWWQRAMSNPLAPYIFFVSFLFLVVEIRQLYQFSSR